MTAKSEFLQRAYQRIDQEIIDLRAQQRELAAQIDAEHLSAKPAFPTEHMREAIPAALARIREGGKASDHLGDPVLGAYTVLVDPGRRWFSVRHGSPYSKRGSGHLWDFSEEDLEAIFDLVRENGFDVATHWRHADGVSVVVVER